ARVPHPGAGAEHVRRGRELRERPEVRTLMGKARRQQRLHGAPSSASPRPTGARWASSWACGSACGRTPFTSAVATIGRNRTKRQNIVKKRPKLPSRQDTSQTVGRKYPHADGRKSRWSEVTMITNRSNHIPMLTKIDITKRIGMLVRAFLNQNTCGLITLQLIIVQ